MLLSDAGFPEGGKVELLFADSPERITGRLYPIVNNGSSLGKMRRTHTESGIHITTGLRPRQKLRGPGFKHGVINEKQIKAMNMKVNQ